MSSRRGAKPLGVADANSPNQTTMKNYTIPVTWECYGHIEIEASSLDEAIEKAEDAGLPCGEYIEGSFRIDHEVLSDT